MASAVVVSADHLLGFARRILELVGCDAAEASIVGTHLVDSDLAGHPSHGVALLPHYVRRVREQKVRPNTPARLVSDDGGPFLLFSGDRGFGQRVARDVTAAAIARCRLLGVAIATLRDAHHIGRLASYGEACAYEGLLALLFANATDHAPFVAPHRGSTGRISTNPICIAIPPGVHTGAVVADLATSAISFGKARVALERGTRLQPAVALDENGDETTDPAAIVDGRGSLLPAAEHKGYALAVVIDLLAVLVGGRSSAPHPSMQDSTINNLLLIVLDPSRLHDRAASGTESDRLIGYLRDSPRRSPDQPVLVPGDPERASRQTLLASGIELPGEVWRELVATAQSVGCAPPITSVPGSAR